jgi:SAM-dependent methyltransferase
MVQDEWRIQRLADMLNQIFDKLIANPTVYDMVQYLAGVGYLHRRLKAQLDQLSTTNSIILDIGGGTGLLNHICHPNSDYICLDIDPAKIGRFRIKNSEGIAVVADGTCLPFQSESVDILLCTCVAHHLDNNNLRYLIIESSRVLRRKGRLILLDPVWIPSRLPGVLLWRYDRGSYPRTESDLENCISENFVITYSERMAIFHGYTLYVAAKI